MLADGSFIVDRAQFVGKPVHRVDLSVRKRFSLGGQRTIEGVLDVFNTFNHKNYGSYTTQVSNARYGQPSFNANVAYQPRIVQLGFRFAF